MAISTLFFDGFDHYATADLPKKYDIHTSATFLLVQSTIARNGGSALESKQTFGGPYYVQKSLGMNARTVVLGFACYPTSSGADDGNNQCPLSLWAGATIQLTLRLNSVNRLELRRGTGGGTLLATSVNTLPQGAWSYVELRVYIDDVAGEWEIRINGVTDSSGTGVDTKNSTDNFVNDVRFYSLYQSGSGKSIYIDDLYIRGDTVLTAGGFLGDRKVILGISNGDGTYSQYTPNSGVDLYSRVNEATPDGDTSYITGSAGQKFSLNHADISGVSEINAVQHLLYAKKTDAGDLNQAHFIKSGATEQAGAAVWLSTDYRYYAKVYETDPATSAAWTPSGFNAAEFGGQASS